MQSSVKPVVIIVGTRPEGIKMAPVYAACKHAGLPVLLCATTQHKDLLGDIFPLFDMQVDVDFDLMKPGQDLFYLTQSILQKTKELFLRVKPAMVLVQGDTTSTMAAALSAFYLNIPIGHVEAGLRTHDMRAPFPEEMNRCLVSLLATYHFAPTDQALAHLLAASVDKKNIFLTGNTVVDALRIMQERIVSGRTLVHNHLRTLMHDVQERACHTFLLTIHRRESFNGGIQAVLRTVKEFLVENPQAHCIYPFHPNPHVLRALEESGIAHVSNISLFEPLAYQDMVYVLSRVSWIMTDSGGIQEEAVSLRKPVLVLREKTERMEGVWAGLAHLVGFDASCIKKNMHMIMGEVKVDHAHGESLYGDGYAAQRIAGIVQSVLEKDPVLVQERAVVDEIVAARVIKDEPMKRVCVVGLGYIGLPTAIVIAENGIEVIGVDIDERRVRSINNGDPVIQEPSLFEKLHIALQSGAFRATTAIEHADYFIIAVPTPFNADKTADLSHVLSAVASIATVLKPGNVIILESTVPVGTTQKIAALLEQSTRLIVGRDFFVSYCPERVLPGNIFHELVENARIIGGVDMPSMEQAKWLYKKFVRGALYLTDSKTAEMVKLVENSSRDVSIAFANQVAAMAYETGLNPYEVIELANKHPRVKVLTPTSGVGGHCIAVDPWFLIETFPASSTLLKNAREINDRKPHEVLSMIECAIDAWHTEHTGQKATVLLLGLTYKPDVDDMRESPAFAIAQRAQRWTHVSTLVSEPHISKALLAHHFGMHGVHVTDGLTRADIVVFLVAHTRFKAIDKELLKTKKIIDVCGILHEPQKQEQGEYFFWPVQSLAQATVGNVDKGKEI